MARGDTRSRTRRKRGIQSIEGIMTKREQDVYDTALMYDTQFANKKITYYFNSKGIPKKRTVYFYIRNFMHLCGVRRYVGGWKRFYRDCLKNNLRLDKVMSLQPKFVEPKLDALAQLPKLLDRTYVGFSDNSVVHKGTDYGEMVRTHKDLIALGTVEDSVTHNQVPISLINVEVSSDGMKKATSNWNKIANIKIESFNPEDSKDTHTYTEERELDEKRRRKAQSIRDKNRHKQLQANKKGAEGV